MANADKPRGFRFGYTLHGGPPSIRHYQIADASTTGVYDGDALYISAGRVAAVTDGSTAPFGVAAAYTNSSDVTVKIPVYDDLRNTVFIAQLDDATILGSSLCGPNLFYDITATAGTTASNTSLQEIDGNASTHDTLFILDKVDRPDNAWGGNVDVYCQFHVDIKTTLIASAAT
uniref:Uncharacterized protein n=1 Tax=viral metagenome TaxID=1070528 RepID=A0A6M3XTF1_9ZZZZ